MIYTNDQPPAHVHIINADGECVVEIAQNCVVSVRNVYNMDSHDVRLALAIAEAHADLILDSWRKYHGN